MGMNHGPRHKKIKKTSEDLKEIFRRIMKFWRAVYENNAWRIRYNEEIDNILHGVDIVRFIKPQRLRSRDVDRMDENRIIRKVLKTEFNMLREEDPKLRW